MISPELKKRIFTSLFLICLLLLMFFHTYILIISLTIISLISWIEFYGLIIKIFNKKNNDIVYFPALNIKVVDTLGAGDAVYSYTSCLVKNKCNPKLLALVGAIAGALKTNILGHSNWVSLKQVERSLEAILK